MTSKRDEQVKTLEWAGGNTVGPRDGLMLGLSRITGWSVRLTRTALEIAVLGGGWLLGGVREDW